MELVVREGLLRTLEDAYPNVLSMDDLIRYVFILACALVFSHIKSLQRENADAGVIRSL